MRRLLFGTDEPVAAARELRAGRLTARLRGTRLGPVCFDGHEVWHGVDFLYRDPDWGTPQPVVDRLEHTEGAEGFRLVLHGHIEAGLGFEIGIDAGERQLRYSVTATVRDELRTNRTGLVVMHPLSACGRRVEIAHTDGRASASTLPALVAPWPPFTLVRAIRHEYADDAWAACRFEGDDFELEDQRNNGDASFKTYSRSNLMPRPYLLRAGTVLQQSVDLRIEGLPSLAAPAAAGVVRVRMGEPAAPQPAIGTLVAPADLPLAGALQALAPALLHVVLERPDEAFDAAALARLLAAAGCGLRLDVARVTAPDPQLRRLAAGLQAAGVQPAQVAVFPSTPPVLDAARQAFPAARIGGGTPHFFTQLNRIEDLGRVDFLTFTTASVVHGADDEEIMAGLQSLRGMVDTLRFRHGPLPIHVGPSSIGARRSPLGDQPASDGSRRLALARRDPRTRGLYGAAWAVGYLAQFARAGVQAVTLFDLAGDAALVDESGHATPAFEVLRRLGRPARCRAVYVDAPAALAVLALDRTDGGETVLANLGAEPLQVDLDGAPAHALVMDAASLLQRSVDPHASHWRRTALAAGVLRLEPYAVACV